MKQIHGNQITGKPLKENQVEFDDDHTKDIISNIPWILGIIFLVGFFIFFGHYSVKTNVPKSIIREANILPSDEMDYIADTDSNHGQDLKIIYGKGNNLKRSNVSYNATNRLNGL